MPGERKTTAEGTGARSTGPVQQGERSAHPLSSRAEGYVQPAARIRSGLGLRSEIVLLVLLTVLAGVLRMRGIDFLLPHQTEQDGHVLEDEVLLLASGDPNRRRPNPDGLYPQLLPRLAILAPILPGEAGPRVPR